MADKIGKKQIIINADDFGYSDERNKGIVESFVRGMVSSVSLLVNGSSALEAVALAKENMIPLGLHLNLTEGLPSRKGVNTLTDDSGFLRGKMGFREALRNGEINQAEIEMEIAAQLGWFQENVGSLPTHVDGHQHVHVLPTVNRIFAQVLQRFGVVKTRIPIELGLDSCAWIAGAREAFYSSVIDCAEEAKQIFFESGIRYPCTFVGLSTMGRDMTIDRIKQALNRAFSSQNNVYQKQQQNSQEQPYTGGIHEEARVCELMVHPGYKTRAGHGGCGQGPDDFACSDDREYELQILTSQLWKKFLEEEHLEVISFEDLSAAS